MERVKINTWARWLHFYLSMFSFTALLFFASTGFIMNHPGWTDNQQKTDMLNGIIDTVTLAGRDTTSVSESQILKYFRDKHNIKAQLTELRTDDQELSLSFNGPGYTAYGIINRSTGSYELMVTKGGFLAVFNDLHKGHETGKKWKLIIDITALLLLVVSLTGFIMIFFITKRRSKGLWIAVLGAVTFGLLCFLFM